MPDRAAALLGRDLFATVLVVALGDPAAARAVAGGLGEAGWPVEVVAPAGVADLDARFDARLHAARAVILVAPELGPADLRGSLPGEIATRARQGGVACHAIVARNDLDPFGARILDLQAIREVRGPEEATAAARTLGGLL